MLVFLILSNFSSLIKIDELGSEEEIETIEAIDQTVLQSTTNNGM